MDTSTKSIDDLIEEIISSTAPSQVFPDYSVWKDRYRELGMLLHPDKCKHPSADEAMMKLNEYAKMMDKGQTHADDLGVLTYKAKSTVLVSDKLTEMKHSKENYDILLSLDGDDSKHFAHYLPSSINIEENIDLKHKYIVVMPKRAVPLTHLAAPVPEEHVRWILNRMLAICCYFRQIGFAHCGLNRNSLYISPEDHGMYVVSFYHWTKLGNRVLTLSGPNAHLYPADLYRDKVATEDIDLVTVKKIAIQLLGDQSGIGNKLKSTVSSDLLDFLQQRHTHPVIALEEYRELLETKYEKKFFELTV